jgi:hypothetical protein
LGTVELIGVARFGTLLREAGRWCERITLCLSAPRSEHGTIGLWFDLLAAQSKFERVIVHDAAATEGWLLHRLHETSTLRLIPGTHRRFEDQLLHFERDGRVRLFLARSPLARETLEGDCGAIVHFEGQAADDFARSFQRQMDQWRDSSRILTAGELDALTASAPDSAPARTSPCLELDANQRTPLAVYGRAVVRSELDGERHRNGLPLDGDTIITGAPSDDVPRPAELRVPCRSPSVDRASPDASPGAPPAKAAAANVTASSPLTGRRMDSDAPASDTAATIDLTGRVQGIPPAARQHFEALLRAPIESRAELIQRARAHVANVELASHHNEFIDISQAKALVERMDRLLEQVETLSPITRRIARAAVLYFISTQDAADDFDLGGLDDDEAVLAAVFAHLELS